MGKPSFLMPIWLRFVLPINKKAFIHACAHTTRTPKKNNCHRSVFLLNSWAFSPLFAPAWTRPSELIIAKSNFEHLLRFFTPSNSCLATWSTTIRFGWSENPTTRFLVVSSFLLFIRYRRACNKEMIAGHRLTHLPQGF